MHPAIYQEFEEIISRHEVTGAVLEVGAVPRDTSLLCMESLKRASEKIGINLDGPFSYKDIRIIKGNANNMSCFDDNKFDAVVCNAMLEHDKYFWKTIGEIKRVTRPGGLIVIGVPAFVQLPGEVAYIDDAANVRIEGVAGATITYEIHAAPEDYYRFSPQAIVDVLFEGMKDVHVQAMLLPPRIIGYGFNP